MNNFARQFFLINDTPHKVAAGAAVGVFFGIMPGEGVATTLVVASVLRLNRLSATAGVLATNMWTTAVALPPSAAIGGWLFHTNRHELVADFRRAYHLGLKYFLSKAILLDLALPLAVGFLIVSGAIAIAVYVCLWYLLTHHKVKALKP